MRHFVLFLLLCLPALHAAETQVKPTAPADEQAIPLNELVPLRQGPEVQFAFLCLDNGKIAHPDALKASIVKWFKLKSADDIRKFKYNAASRSFSWGVGRSRFVATLELLPIPKGDILYAANNSLHWPGADEAILKHQANYTVTCTSIHRTAWHAALDLTHAIAALSDCHDPTGVYWGDAAIVHSPDSFLHQANYYVGDAQKKIPGALWVGILFEADKNGGWNIFTDGFGPLGHKDIEIHTSQLKRGELFALIDQVKQDVFSGKITLKADLTITDKNNGKWIVSEAQSILGNKKPIWLLTQQP